MVALKQREKTMYTVKNYQTKKELKQDFANGKEIRVFQPNEMFPHNPNGETTIEGPHYPQPHRWYARVTIANDVITKILG